MSVKNKEMVQDVWLQGDRELQTLIFPSWFLIAAAATAGTDKWGCLFRIHRGSLIKHLPFRTELRHTGNFDAHFTSNSPTLTLERNNIKRCSPHILGCASSGPDLPAEA